MGRLVSPPPSLAGSLAILMLATAPVSSQEVRCVLGPDADSSFSGECRAAAGSMGLRLRRATEPSDALWVGIVTTTRGRLDVEVSTYQYSAGPALVLRADAWRILTEWSFADGQLELAWDASAEAPPSELDLRILRAASAMLDREEIWDREDDRNCDNDGQQMSVYCALARATSEIMGRYQHRQPAMQAVRRVIAAEWSDRIVDHRLMNFNNDPRTTLTDVRRLFELSEGMLLPAVR